MANALMVEYHKSVVGHASSSRPVCNIEDLNANSVTASTCGGAYRLHAPQQELGDGGRTLSPA